MQSVKNEIGMHWELTESAGTLNLQEIFIDENLIYLVLDYQEQGSLLSKILKSETFSEEQTKLIMT